MILIFVYLYFVKDSYEDLKRLKINDYEKKINIYVIFKLIVNRNKWLYIFIYCFL